MLTLNISGKTNCWLADVKCGVILPTLSCMEINMVLCHAHHFRGDFGVFCYSKMYKYITKLGQ